VQEIMVRFCRLVLTGPAPSVRVYPHKVHKEPSDKPQCVVPSVPATDLDSTPQRTDQAKAQCLPPAGWLITTPPFLPHTGQSAPGLLQHTDTHRLREKVLTCV